MTQTQFDLIAALARIKQSSGSYRAVQLVHLHGAKQIDAARVTGITPGTVSRAYARFLLTWRITAQSNL